MKFDILYFKFCGICQYDAALLLEHCVNMSYVLVSAVSAVCCSLARHGLAGQARDGRGFPF